MQLVCLISLGQGFDDGFQKYPPSSMKEDLDFIFKKYGEVHPEFYKDVSKEEVNSRLQALKAQINKPLNTLLFYEYFVFIYGNLITCTHLVLTVNNNERRSNSKLSGQLCCY